jgi:agmatine deiminase
MLTNSDESYFPAEWHLQSAVQLVWPSINSDWKDNYKEVTQCYLDISKAILGSQNLLITFPMEFNVNTVFSAEEQNQMVIIYAEYNDTWVRDFGGISVFNKSFKRVLDFKFNGWGNKFESGLDNQQTSKMFEKKLFSDNVQYNDQLDFVLEGGAVDSNGKGLLLTTKSCLLNTTRNGQVNKIDIEKKLKKLLNVGQILWLSNGQLMGDDTDGHIDTLVRFTSENSLLYVQCLDKKDMHYNELRLMEEELTSLCEEHNLKMVPLPMPGAVFHLETKERLPATYANFLILNTMVLVPSYGCPQDGQARTILQSCFTDRKIISVNSLPLIQQGGSLHCASMQYPEGFVK